MSIKLYGTSLSPFVRKVRLALHAKELPYQLEEFFPGQGPEHYSDISPLGKIPALMDGPYALSDSSVICAYLDKSYTSIPIYPQEAKAYGRVLWIEEYTCNALAAVVQKLLFEKVVGPLFFAHATDERVVDQLTNEALVPLLSYLNSRSGKDFALSDTVFSVADFSVFSFMRTLVHLQVDFSAYSALHAFYQTMEKQGIVKKLAPEEEAALAAIA